jgi:hypothetical protein
MRRMLVLAFCAISATAAAAAPREVLDAVQRLSPATALDPALHAAPCAFAPVARHLDPLPTNIAWAQPRAAVLFTGLPGLGAGQRAAIIRPTRELMARAATRARIAEGGVTLHAIDLAPLPADAPAPAFLAIHIASPATPPEGCVAAGPR